MHEMYATKVSLGCFMFAVTILVPGYTLETRCITIGVIADVKSPVSYNQEFVFYNYNVTYIWITVNTDEIYQVYNAVHQLDEDPAIDVIIHADVSQASQHLPHLLETRSTPLIRWGIKRRQGIRAQHFETCLGENTTVFVSDNVDLACALRTEMEESNLTIMHDYTRNVPGAIAKLLMRLKWKFVIVLYDSESEHEASTLIDHLSVSKIMIVAINIDTVKNLEEMVFKLYTDLVKDAKKIQILVACRYHCTRKIARMANTFDEKNSAKQKTLLRQFSMWLFILYGYERKMSRGIRACADDIDNVAVVAIPDWKGLDAKLITTDVKRILLQYEQELFDQSLDIIIEKEDVIDRLVQETNMKHPSVRCKGFYIDTLLWTANERRSFSNVGFIDVSGDVLMTSELFPNTKYGYNKRTFLVSTLDYKPFVMSNFSANGTKSYYGFCIDILENLAVSLNFTYVLTEPADGKWGSFINQEKEEFNGLIGQLQNKEVDIVAAPISIQADRSRQMDFTYPFYYEYTTIVTKRLNPMQRKWRTLIDPFKWEVLVAIGISLFVVTSLLWLIEKCNPFYSHGPNAELRRQNGGLHYWHNSFWYMYGALLCQGGVHLPDSVAGRTFVSCWWLFCIIVVGTYCGNLIAFLTVTKDKPPFTNLQEMVDLKGEYKWGTLGGTAWESIFIQTSKVPLYRDVGRGIIEFNRTDPSVLEQGPLPHIEKVLQGGYAWIGDKTYIDFHMATECDLVRAKHEFLPLTYAFGFQKNSPHTVTFRDQLMKIHEGGLLAIWKRKWWPRVNYCDQNEIVMQSKPITLPDVQSAFYVCLLGIGLGLLAFIGENIIYRYKIYKHRKDIIVNRQIYAISQIHLNNDVIEPRC